MCWDRSSSIKACLSGRTSASEGTDPSMHTVFLFLLSVHFTKLKLKAELHAAVYLQEGEGHVKTVRFVVSCY